MARPAEFAHGDEFFSPFIAPGRSEREEMNLRPAQTLGILKALFAVGAEYIHVGFFNSAARGENWLWQTVMPSFAQGTAMAVNDLFRASTVLPGDMPLPTLGCYTLGFQQLKRNATLLAQCSKITTAECQNQNVVAEGELCQAPATGDWHGPVSYRFWAGSQSVAVYVRKHSSKSIFLIYGTVQPQSNQMGNAPLALNVSIQLSGSTVAFEVRRQGSTYVLDNTTTTTTTSSGGGGGGGGGGESSSERRVLVQPSWTQVDAWHEPWHPAYWAKSFVFEAEAHAGLATDAKRTADTLTERRAAHGSGDNAFDFVGATSFVSVSSAAAAMEYIFRPRGGTSSGLTAWVRLRWAMVLPVTNRGSSCVVLSVDGRVVGSGCAEASNAAAGFCWTRVGAVPASLTAAETTHVLAMRSGELSGQPSAPVHVDRLGLFVAAEAPSQYLDLC